MEGGMMRAWSEICVCKSAGMGAEGLIVSKWL